MAVICTFLISVHLVQLDSSPLLWWNIFRSTLQICYLSAASSSVSLQIEGAVLLLASTIQYQWESHYILPVYEHTVSGDAHTQCLLVFPLGKEAPHLWALTRLVPGILGMLTVSGRQQLYQGSNAVTGWGIAQRQQEQRFKTHKICFA